MCNSGRNRFGSILFGSGLFENSSFRFCSVHKHVFPGSTRFGLPFSDASWLGPVRTTLRFHVRFRPVPKLNGSVRFGSAGSVRFLVPSCYLYYCTNNKHDTNTSNTNKYNNDDNKQSVVFLPGKCFRSHRCPKANAGRKAHCGISGARPTKTYASIDCSNYSIPYYTVLYCTVLYYTILYYYYMRFTRPCMAPWRGEARATTRATPAQSLSPSKATPSPSLTMLYPSM